MPIDKDRIPQVGETVYQKGDTKCVRMYLERVYKKGKREYGLCTWTSYEMFDDELVGQSREKEFPFGNLTIYPPTNEA
jgi:hypothetical protein